MYLINNLDNFLSQVKRFSARLNVSFLATHVTELRRTVIRSYFCRELLHSRGSRWSNTSYSLQKMMVVTAGNAAKTSIGRLDTTGLFMRRQVRVLR